LTSFPERRRLVLERRDERRKNDLLRGHDAFYEGAVVKRVGRRE
jgi:hypothetical protein